MISSEGKMNAENLLPDTKSMQTFWTGVEHHRSSRVLFSEYVCFCHLPINSPFHDSSS